MPATVPESMPHYRPLKRVEYDDMVDRGFFVNERIELLRGMLVPMSPQKPPHAGPVTALNRILMQAASDDVDVRVQLPFAATDDSEPEPDIAVVPLEDPFTAHPTEAYLIIEVAHTSHVIDRRVKTGIYAEAGVPEYWIVDIPGGRVEIYSQPHNGTYAKVDFAPRGAILRPPGIDVDVVVDAILPPVV